MRTTSDRHETLTSVAGLLFALICPAAPYGAFGFPAAVREQLGTAFGLAITLIVHNRALRAQSYVQVKFKSPLHSIPTTLSADSSSNDPIVASTVLLFEEFIPLVSITTLPARLYTFNTQTPPLPLFVIEVEGLESRCDAQRLAVHCWHRAAQPDAAEG